MNKSYLVGYYGMKNTGDDALLTACTHWSKEYLGSQEVIVNTPLDMEIPFHGHTHSILEEKQRFPAQNRFRQYKAAYASNQIVFGGGSVLQNQRDIDLKRDLITLSGNHQSVALGIGIGPFENTKAEKSCAHLLNTLDYVGVRDQISYDIAKSIAPWANVDYTFDLAPSLLPLIKDNLQHKTRKGIAVCLCPHEELKGRPVSQIKRHKEIAEALRRVYALTGEPITFVDFNGHDELGDHAVHQEVALLMRGVPHEIISYNANPLATLNKMSEFKVVLSMRLHASIFAFLMDTPVISMDYHQKCAAWCEQIGMPSQYHFPTDETNRESLSETLFAGLELGFERNTLSVNNAIQRSMNNWRYAHEQLSFKNISHHSFV